MPEGGLIMKKKGLLLGLIATVCTFVATAVASSACWYYFYQPEEPSSLQDM